MGTQYIITLFASIIARRFFHPKNADIFLIPPVTHVAGTH